MCLFTQPPEGQKTNWALLPLIHHLVEKCRPLKFHLKFSSFSYHSSWGWQEKKEFEIGSSFPSTLTGRVFFSFGGGVDDFEPIPSRVTFFTHCLFRLLLFSRVISDTVEFLVSTNANLVLAR